MADVSGHRGRHEVLVSIAPGLEAALRDELEELGFRARIITGGVELETDTRGIYTLNLWSRLAARVTVRVGRARTRSLDQLAAYARGLPWGDYIVAGQPVQVRAALHESKLRHRGAVQRKVELAIQDAMRGPRLPGPRPPRHPTSIVVHIASDDATFSVDSSGPLLHRRGWRKATAKAPLRENLAAAVLRLADWAPGEPLADPMCGAGTFPIEAATIAMGIPPGVRRRFAFQTWPIYDRRAYKELLNDARSRRPLDTVSPIVGSDRDPGAVNAARDNARRAAVAGRVELSHARITELERPGDRGLLVINPPYGARISAGNIGRLYKGIGRALQQRWMFWRLAILLPGRRHRAALGLPVNEVATFSNGGIDVVLFVGPISG